MSFAQKLLPAQKSPNLHKKGSKLKFLISIAQDNTVLSLKFHWVILLTLVLFLFGCTTVLNTIGNDSVDCKFPQFKITHNLIYRVIHNGFDSEYNLDVFSNDWENDWTIGSQTSNDLKGWYQDPIYNESGEVVPGMDKYSFTYTCRQGEKEGENMNYLYCYQSSFDSPAYIFRKNISDQGVIKPEERVLIKRLVFDMGKTYFDSVDKAWAEGASSFSTNLQIPIIESPCKDNSSIGEFESIWPKR